MAGSSPYDTGHAGVGSPYFRPEPTPQQQAEFENRPVSGLDQLIEYLKQHGSYANVVATTSYSTTVSVTLPTNPQFAFELGLILDQLGLNLVRQPNENTVSATLHRGRIHWWATHRQMGKEPLEIIRGREEWSMNR